jgi:preprotein translocase subunit SecF
LVGTYSSVFVAAPIVLWWGKGRREAIAGRKAAVETSA